MAITAKIEGNKLIITADLETPAPNASGKTLVVASTRGNKETDMKIDGKPVITGLNAYIRKQQTVVSLPIITNPPLKPSAIIVP